jgi:hypothetical protein
MIPSPVNAHSITTHHITITISNCILLSLTPTTSHQQADCRPKQPQPAIGEREWHLLPPFALVSGWVYKSPFRDFKSDHRR